MDVHAIWDQVTQTIEQVPRSGLLMGALAAMALGLAGSAMIRRFPELGKAMRLSSTIGLMVILLLVVLQLSRMDPRFSLAMPEMGLPEQVVEGGETRIPMSADGHYWLEASLNGHRANFLVDTGATLTAVGEETAKAAGLEVRDGGLPVRLQTANGAIAAQMTSIDELRFGNVAARGLDAVIAPGMGDTNVIGMNLLSRLKAVRLQDKTMVLVPHQPQPALEPSS